MAGFFDPTNMRIERKRGTNSVTFVFTERKPENQVAALRSFRGNIIKYLSYKYRSPYGGSVPPEDVVVKIKHGYDPSTVKKNINDDRYYDYTYTANMYTVKTMMKPTPVAVLNYAADIVENFAQDQIEKKEVNPNRNYELRDDYRIKSVTLTWIYPPEIMKK